QQRSPPHQDASINRQQGSVSLNEIAGLKFELAANFLQSHNNSGSQSSIAGPVDAIAQNSIDPIRV
ncbi:MAG: hypothetical protein AAFO87_05220, partial [Cyanobacteria bacterium J06607_6]